MNIINGFSLVRYPRQVFKELDHISRGKLVFEAKLKGACDTRFMPWKHVQVFMDMSWSFVHGMFKFSWTCHGLLFMSCSSFHGHVTVFCSCHVQVFMDMLWSSVHAMSCHGHGVWARGKGQQRCDLLGTELRD